MNITEVKIYKLTDSKTLALASITLDNEFVVSGLKVLKGSKGLWVALPSRKNKEGEYKDICFPITKEARMDIQNAVLNKFNLEDTPHFPEPKKNERQQEHDILGVNSEDLPF